MALAWYHTFQNYITDCNNQPQTNWKKTLVHSKLIATHKYRFSASKAIETKRVTTPLNFKNSSFSSLANLSSPTESCRNAAMTSSKVGCVASLSHRLSISRRNPLIPSWITRGLLRMTSRSSTCTPTCRPMSIHFNAAPLRTEQRWARSFNLNWISVQINRNRICCCFKKDNRWLVLSLLGVLVWF